MPDENNALLDLNGGAILYNDLRSKIDAKYTKPASGIPASDIASGVIPTVPVQDVQVNGTSVLSNGVANIPIASSSNPGTIKVVTTGSYGLTIDQNTLLIATASENLVKAGTDIFKPITSKRTDAAAFYGLAKAAGDTTQSQSSNAVGTYTDAAKTAIQNMLGVQPGLEVVRLI